MNFDLTTFILEIINFIVLVWLLRRILYDPVMTAVKKRQTFIADKIAVAEEKEANASRLKLQTQNRLADWDEERRRLLAELLDELQVKRRQEDETLKVQLEQEQKKAEAQNQRRMQQTLHEYELSALAIASKFASTLLARLALS